MKKFILLLAMAAFLLPSSLKAQEVIKIGNISIEILTSTVNVKKLPMLIKGVVMYLQSNDNKMIKNYYVKLKKGELDNSNHIKVYVQRYKAKKEIIFRITTDSGKSYKDKLVKIKLTRFDRPKKISQTEISARNKVKQFLIREGEVSEEEAKKMIKHIIYISEGIDKIYQKN